MRSADESPREAGFTLAETLVVIAVFSLLAATLFGAVRFGLRAWQGVSNRAVATDEVLAVQDYLRHAIANAYPAFVRETSARGHLDFSGTRTSMVFVGPSPLSRGIGGRARINLIAEPSGQGMALTVSAQPELQAGNQSEMKDVILRDLRDIEFAYRGSVRSQRAEWQSTWEGLPAMPSMIRIRASFGPDDPRIWPDLVIVPRIDVDVTCVYDTLTKLCRGR
ncbi:prepilin-type N-terminal cleavage/methylation domain-containing protein [Bradyrhizobium sp. WD16]|uniref:prepilin-type N-terminal cleavage/methylation domain-containing protein n=1 Tax=Bradyrhizobium sp. WD16 TaxID=1521768 RepID=UPI0021123CB6|nr:prepilin-type N-terminal cleavage/methylation domain-containing protein [Bradyrhizobium sp. WD16]UTD29045.1 prepilin-type cleavage/methylation domain-containing protein [Bradyrhizobium sp. WD16]